MTTCHTAMKNTHAVQKAFCHLAIMLKETVKLTQTTNKQGLILLYYEFHHCHHNVKPMD